MMAAYFSGGRVVALVEDFLTEVLHHQTLAVLLNLAGGERLAIWVAKRSIGG
jgi:hypothetical protein